MTTPYTDGTVSIANGGTTVTGVGTAWAGVVREGDELVINGLATYATADAASNTSFSVAAWPGSTVSGASYYIRFTSDGNRASERARQVVEQLSAIDANGRGLFYGFSTTTTDADPGAGVLRLNNATIASATAAYLDNLDANGATVSTILDTWDDTGSSAGRGQLWVRQIADPSIFHAWNVTGSVVDGTGYRKLTLSYIGGSGSFANADEIMVQFVPVGNGENGEGVPAGGTTGQVLKKASGTDYDTEWAADAGGIGGSTGSTDNRLIRADGTGGATVQDSAITVDDSGNISGVGTLASGAITSAGDSLFQSSSTPVQHSVVNNAAPTAGAFLMRRARGSVGSESAVQSGDTIAGINARGYGATSYSSLGRASFSFRATENWTDTAQGTDFIVETTTTGGTSRSARLTVQLGLLMAGASGGDKGAGTINATAVYDDDSLLTCVALQTEFLERGEIDLAKWDALAPDLVEPERREEVQVTWPLRQVRRRQTIKADADGRLIRRVQPVEETVEVPAFIADPVYDEGGNIVDAVETPLVDEVVIPQRITKRVHRTARLFKAMIDDGFDPRDPEQYFAKLRADEALPGMPTKADWEHNTLSMGEQFSRKWLAMEMLAIVANVMWIKLKDHETRIEALESSVRG